MPSLEDFYRKFGEASEAAQLVETEFGTMLLFYGAVSEGIISPDLKADGKRATELLARINRQTLGQLIKNTKRHNDDLEKLDSLFLAALEERNRLSHHFYRQHNLRKNSEAGRTIMLDDLEQIHKVLLDAFKALHLLQGTDLEALVAERAKEAGSSTSGTPTDAPLFHLPI